ncbi:hypothetical protein [Gardnerella sp. DNF01157]|uniref:hypothetical protein n=1 Tax=Gardnerella sp. DNF01157 TaxID=2749060 RepID=UPI003BA8BD0C
MESDKSYRARLKNQIKDACGKVIYTYTAHHKLADRLEKENKYVKNAQIILTALSSCGFFLQHYNKQGHIDMDRWNYCCIVFVPKSICQGM